MKLVFERDIPELQGKSWREKMALRRQARLIDPRIPLRSALIQGLTVPWWILLLCLWHQRILKSLLEAVVIYSVVAFILGILSAALWVNPLLAQALRSPKT